MELKDSKVGKRRKRSLSFQNLRVTDEFENAILSASNKEVNFEHPESSVAGQNNFLKDLKALLYLAKEGTVVNHSRTQVQSSSQWTLVKSWTQ